MLKFRYPSFRATLLVGAMTLAVAFASAQVTSQEPVLNTKIQEAARPYRESRSASESLKRFQELNSQTPDDPDVQSWLGFLYIQTGAPEKAIAPLEAAAAQRPANLEVQINLGNAYFSSNPPQYDKALACYAKVSAGRSSMYEPRYNSGVIYLQKGDYPQAIQELKAAEALDPKNAFIKNNLGVAYEKSKDDKNAAAKFREASDLLPEDKTFARNAGLSVLKSRSNPSDAKPYLDRADGNDPSVALALGSLVTSADPPKALAYYETAEKGIDDPKYGYSRKQRETYWYNLGVLRSQTVKGDPASAQHAYERALELDPSDVDALKNLGMLHYRSGHFTEAETAFDKLTGLVPTSFDAWRNLGLAATKAHDQPKAIAAYREAVKLGGAGEAQELIKVRVGLADELYNNGDYTGAATQYRQILQMEKNSPQALNGLGLVYMKGKKFAQAEAAFRSAIASDAQYADAYNNLGIILEQLYRRKEAIAMVEKAHSLSPKDANINKNLNRLKGG